jgi:hypothetical protein
MLLKTAVVAAVVLSIQVQIRLVQAHRQPRGVILDTEMPVVLEIKHHPQKVVVVVVVLVVLVQTVQQPLVETVVLVVNIVSQVLLHIMPQAVVVAQEPQRQRLTELVVLASAEAASVQAHM